MVFDGDSGSVLCRRWRGLLAVTSRKCANIHWHLVIQMNMTLPLTIPSSGMWHILGCTEQGGSCLTVLRNVAHTLGCTVESGIHSWLYRGKWHTLLAVPWKVVYTLGCAEERGTHSWLYCGKWYTLLAVLRNVAHTLGCTEEHGLFLAAWRNAAYSQFLRSVARQLYFQKAKDMITKSIVLRKDICCYVLGANMRAPSQNG